MLPEIDALSNVLRGRRVAVLTGAGCSTESGIPDYRGPDAGRRVRKPIQYQEFMRSDVARVRYWARSAIGWARVSAATPNAGHRALSELEARGFVAGVITQNVDGLHGAAGSRRVIELHGSLAMIRCLGCGARVMRADFQNRLLALNSEWAAHVLAGEFAAAPDGDADLDAAWLADFHVPACECGGILKPDVVFFGENVPRDVVQQAFDLLADADALLVAGSSLEVYSGRRFVDRAREDGKPVAIINLGATRCDDAATIKLDAPLGVALPALSAALETTAA